MSTIIYTLKVEPYETGERFKSIKDTRETKIEFDIADLTDEQRELWLKVANKFNSTHTLQQHELKPGSDPSTQGFGKHMGSEAQVWPQNYTSEAELNLNTAFTHILRDQEHKQQLQAQADEINERRDAIRDQIRQQEAEAKERAEQKRAEEAAKARAAAPVFDWNAENTAICNLYDKIHTVSGVEMDTRHNGNWIKTITGVDRAKKNGYMFEGEWVRNQTIEVENRPAVYLVAGTSGSRKYQQTTYQVVVLRGGKLEKTDIRVTDDNGGWALLIRDRVAKLLDEIGGTIKDEFESLREAVQLDTEMVAVDRQLLAKLLARVSS